MDRAQRRRLERQGLKVEETVRRLVTPKNPRFENELIIVAYISAGQNDNQMSASLAQAQSYDMWTDQRIAGVINLESGPRIVESRTQVVESFLHDERLRRPDNGLPCELLMLIDDDMKFEEDAIHKLYHRMQEENLDICGGLCFAGNLRDMYPTVYGEAEVDGKITQTKVYDYPREATVKVAGTGAAFLMIRREVLVKMGVGFQTQASGIPNPHPWFVEWIDPEGNQWGEDMMFCRRARGCGFDVWVDTRLKIGHMKRSVLDEKEYDRRRVLAEIDHLIERHGVERALQIVREVRVA